MLSNFFKSCYCTLVPVHLCTIVHYNMVSSVISNTTGIVSDLRECISHFQGMTIVLLRDVPFLPGLITSCFTNWRHYHQPFCKASVKSKCVNKCNPSILLTDRYFIFHYTDFRNKIEVTASCLRTMLELFRLGLLVFGN